MVVTDDHRQFWSFGRLSLAQPPRVSDEEMSSWIRTPIDQFVFDRMDRLGLRPNGSADRRTLIRRAYLDLIGLPPTPEEIDEFVNDRDEHAYENLVDRFVPALFDRLLQSLPRGGVVVK